jgi:hypothetical protein
MAAPLLNGAEQPWKFSAPIRSWNRSDPLLTAPILDPPHLCSYASVNPCFTAGNISVVWNCHAAWRHQKTTVCTSIVYVMARNRATSVRSLERHSWMRYFQKYCWWCIRWREYDSRIDKSEVESIFVSNLDSSTAEDRSVVEFLCPPVLIFCSFPYIII